jgi:hypothetical protein
VAMNTQSDSPLRPAQYCQQAIDAIRVSEERRKRRKRDTGPDLIGMDIKRDLLEQAIDADPEPDDFEAWLLQQVIQSRASGPTRAMALEILAEYENARAVQSFGGWLAEGAPTPRFGDAGGGKRKRRGT